MCSLKYDVKVYIVTYVKLLPNEFHLNLNMRNNQKKSRMWNILQYNWSGLLRKML